MNQKPSLPMRLQQACGGSFHKTALLQKRVRELVQGNKRLVECSSTNPIEVALLELQFGKISLEAIPPPEMDGPDHPVTGTCHICRP